MKQRIMFGLLSLILVLGISTGSVFAKSATTTNLGDSSGPEKPTSIDGRTTGYLIQIGTIYDDANPAVAYSSQSGQYLVVQETLDAGTNQRGIYGSFVDPSVGDRIDASWFFLAQGTQEMGNPDVAYDSINDRFLVVWEEYHCTSTVPAHCAKVIYGRLVMGSYQNGGAKIAGDPFIVASQINTLSTSSDLHDPAVAFNSDDGQYAVIFNQKLTTDTDYHDIYGRMIGAHASTPSPLGDSTGFLMTGYLGIYKTYDLDISWSDSSTNNFFAVWETDKGDGSSRYIPGYYLYDTYQDGGNQVINAWTIAPSNNGDYPLTSDCMAPSVTYDRNNGAYVVVFEYGETVQANMPQEPNLGYATTIYGQRVSGISQSGTFQFDDKFAFPIETALDAENSFHTNPVITASGAAWEDTMIVYKTFDQNELANPDDDLAYVNARSLVGDFVYERFPIRGAAEGNQIWEPTASCHFMNCLVAWQETCVDSCGTNDIFDIHGQLLNDRDSILFDESHDEQNTIDAQRAQQIVDDQEWGEPDWFYFGKLDAKLSGEYLFFRNTDQPLTYNMLKYYGGVILSVPREPFTSSEIKALHNYVASGGGLMLLGDCGFDQNYIYPGLTDPYQLSFEPYCVSAAGNDYIGDISLSILANQPMLESVSSFEMNWGTSMTFGSGSSWLVATPTDVWQDVNGNLTYDPGVDLTGSSLAIAVGHDTGCGRVVAISDNSFQDDAFEGRGNDVFMRALLNWVTDGTECYVSDLYDVYLPMLIR